MYFSYRDTESSVAWTQSLFFAFFFSNLSKCISEPFDMTFFYLRVELNRVTNSLSLQCRDVKIYLHCVCVCVSGSLWCTYTHTMSGLGG